MKIMKFKSQQLLSFLIAVNYKKNQIPHRKRIPQLEV